jgi:hypothetical protein
VCTALGSDFGRAIWQIDGMRLAAAQCASAPRDVPRNLDTVARLTVGQ